MAQDHRLAGGGAGAPGQWSASPAALYVGGGGGGGRVCSQRQSPTTRVHAPQHPQGPVGCRPTQVLGARTGTPLVLGPTGSCRGVLPACDDREDPSQGPPWTSSREAGGGRRVCPGRPRPGRKRETRIHEPRSLSDPRLSCPTGGSGLGLGTHHSSRQFLSTLSQLRPAASFPGARDNGQLPRLQVLWAGAPLGQPHSCALWPGPPCVSRSFSDLALDPRCPEEGHGELSCLCRPEGLRHPGAPSSCPLAFAWASRVSLPAQKWHRRQGSMAQPHQERSEAQTSGRVPGG